MQMAGNILQGQGQKGVAKSKRANRNLAQDIGKTMMMRQDPGPVKANVMWEDRLARFI